MIRQLLAHFSLALIVALAMSTGFWLAWGVFVWPGFAVMSALSAAAGTALGWIFGRSPWVTVLGTVLARYAVFVAATGSLTGAV